MKFAHALSSALSSALCIAVIGLPLSAAAQAADTAAAPMRPQAVVNAVLSAINQRDCAAAVRHLNLGLAQKLPAVMNLAGSMFEGGVCLKANPERAVDWYSRAFEGGLTTAGARLAAFYGAPGAQQDRPAALWWALKAGTPLPAPCNEPRDLVTDADRFVAALQRWEAGRLLHCAHVAAVMSSIEGELEAADLAAELGAAGTLGLVYEPARAQVEILTSNVSRIAQRGGVQAVDTLFNVNNSVVRGKDDPAALVGPEVVRQQIEAGVREVTDRALKRHPRPDGLPSQWRIEARYDLRRATP
jgi:hypothetical protein